MAHVQDDFLRAVGDPLETARLTDLIYVVQDVREEQALLLLAYYLQHLLHNLVVYKEVRLLVRYLNERSIHISGSVHDGHDAAAGGADHARTVLLDHT